MLPSLTSLLLVLEPTMSCSNISILYCLINSMFCVRSKVTTRSLSRYSEYSLRHIFRFLSSSIDWVSFRVLFFTRFLFSTTGTYILAVDETVEGKSGTCSHGISKFYSSCTKYPIKGICLSALSIIHVESKKSFMLHVIQVVYNEFDKLRIAEEKLKKKSAQLRLRSGGKPLQRGRKKGTKNKTKEDLKVDTASLRAFKQVFNETLKAFSIFLPSLKVKYVVGDTAYGNENYAALISKQGLFLISKLYKNAVLFEAKEQIKGKVGRPALYGKRFDLSNLPKEYLKHSEKDDKETVIETYQLEVRSKTMKGRKLNVVVKKAIRKDKKVGTQIFFSTDLELDYETLIKYYRIRFQIEFDFRDAKQHFGLSDFKNYKEKNLTNFINLSFTMTLISKYILQKFREKYKNEKLSILDLKVHYNYQFHTKSIINWFKNNPKINFNSLNEDQFIPNDFINAA